MLGWLLIFMLVVIIVIGIIFYSISDRQHKFARFINGIDGYIVTTVAVSAFLLVIVIAGVAIEQTKSISFVKKYEAMYTEYGKRADNFNSLERIALFKSAAEMIGEAAVYQYWNKHFDPFINDSVNNLKPIR